MEECRPMATPMITNWEKFAWFRFRVGDPTLYRRLIGSLMYLVNTRPDICFAVNKLDGSQDSALGGYETCIEVPTGHSGLWF